MGGENCALASKRSEPAVKYKKKDQRIKEEKKSNISQDVAGFLKQKKNYAYDNKFTLLLEL